MYLVDTIYLRWKWLQLRLTKHIINACVRCVNVCKRYLLPHFISQKCYVRSKLCTKSVYNSSKMKKTKERKLLWHFHLVNFQFTKLSSNEILKTYFARCMHYQSFISWLDLMQRKNLNPFFWHLEKKWKTSDGWRINNGKQNIRWCEWDFVFIHLQSHNQIEMFCGCLFSLNVRRKVSFVIIELTRTRLCRDVASYLR